MIDSKNYLMGKIEDQISRYNCGEVMSFSSFLTAEEAAQASAVCRKYKTPYVLYGGYTDCERKILGLSSLEESIFLTCFPLTLLQIQCPEPELLSNRDVLGALMSTGIRREVLGDIVVRDGLALVFVLDHIKDYLIQNLVSIGRQSVKLMELPLDTPIPERRFEFVRMTVASMRSDAVVSALIHVSREKSNELIDNKLVSVNHVLLEKKTKELFRGDSIVIRGYGKWLIDECESVTKKGRTVLICRKFL